MLSLPGWLQAAGLCSLRTRERVLPSTWPLGPAHLVLLGSPAPSCLYFLVVSAKACLLNPPGDPAGGGSSGFILTVPPAPHSRVFKLLTHSPGSPPSHPSFRELPQLYEVPPPSDGPPHSKVSTHINKLSPFQPYVHPAPIPTSWRATPTRPSTGKPGVVGSPRPCSGH